MMVAMLVALHFSCGQGTPDAIYDGYCGPGGRVPHYDIFSWTPTPPLPEIASPSILSDHELPLNTSAIGFRCPQDLL